MPGYDLSISGCMTTSNIPGQRSAELSPQHAKDAVEELVLRLSQTVSAEGPARAHRFATDLNNGVLAGARDLSRYPGRTGARTRTPVDLPADANARHGRINDRNPFLAPGIRVKQQTDSPQTNYHGIRTRVIRPVKGAIKRRGVN